MKLPAKFQQLLITTAAARINLRRAIICSHALVILATYANCGAQAANAFLQPSLEEACGISDDQLKKGIIALAEPIPLSPAIDALQPNEPVESLTRQILRRELDLQKLNTEFRIQTSLTSRWRQRRVFLYGEANSTCNMVSLAESISARRQLLRSRKKARATPTVNEPVDTDDEPDSNMAHDMAAATTNSGSATSKTTTSNSAPSQKPLTSGRSHGRLQNATELQLIGGAIGASGDLIELSLNLLHYLQARQRGFTPAKYRERVHQIAADLDSLILQRKLAIERRGPFHDSTEQLEDAEGKMLRDLRDLAMVDYMEFHAATKRFWAFQNTAFLLDLSRNGASIAGNVISLYGSHYRRPRYTGSTGVFSAISAGLVMLQPAVGRVTGNISGNAARRLVSRELVNVNVRTSDEFASDRLKLEEKFHQTSSVNPAASALAQRLPLYAKQQALMEEANTSFQNERRRARNTLYENIAFASVVGPPRTASAMDQIVGSWRYYRDPSGKERIYMGGNIALEYASVISMLETARVQTVEELRQHRLGKQHRRAGQLLQARVNTLNTMRTSLK